MITTAASCKTFPPLTRRIMADNVPSRNKIKESHLHRLGEDELRNVLRHLSAHPNRVNWQKKVAPADVSSVLKSGGPLAACARRQFRALNMYFEDERMSSLSVDVESESNAAVFEHLLVELGPVLQGMSLTSPLPFSDTHFDQCKSLRYLHLTCGIEPTVMRSILQASKGSLRELFVRGDILEEYTANSIADNCSGLRNLAMTHDQVEGSLRRVWEAVGPSLKELTLDVALLDAENRLDIIAEIAEHCVNLKTFGYISKDKSKEDLLVLLLDKFGQQLQCLRTSNCSLFLSHDLISKIMRRCPHLLIDARYGKQSLDSLPLFGDRLRAVVTNDKNPEIAKEAGSSVPSLEELSIFFYKWKESAHFLSEFFFWPKHFLKKLTLYNLNSDIAGEDNPLDVLAKLVWGLEELWIGTRRIEESVFRLIAEANEGLKRVYVSCDTIHKNEKHAEDVAVSFVEDFSNCPILTTLFLRIKNLPTQSVRIADACVPLRRRLVDVFVYSKLGRQPFILDGYCTHFQSQEVTYCTSI